METGRHLHHRWHCKLPPLPGNDSADISADIQADGRGTIRLRSLQTSNSCRHYTSCIVVLLVRLRYTDISAHNWKIHICALSITFTTSSKEVDDVPMSCCELCAHWQCLASSSILDVDDTASQGSKKDYKPSRRRPLNTQRVKSSSNRDCCQLALHQIHIEFQVIDGTSVDAQLALDGSGER